MARQPGLTPDRVAAVAAPNQLYHEQCGTHGSGVHPLTEDLQRLQTPISFIIQDMDTQLQWRGRDGLPASR